MAFACGQIDEKAAFCLKTFLKKSKGTFTGKIAPFLSSPVLLQYLLFNSSVSFSTFSVFLF